MRNLYIYFTAIAAIITLGISAEITFLSAEENLIQQKCSKCHSAPLPDNYTKAEWKYNVERMAKRAGLTTNEIQSIIDMNKKK